MVSNVLSPPLVHFGMVNDPDPKGTLGRALYLYVCLRGQLFGKTSMVRSDLDTFFDGGIKVHKILSSGDPHHRMLARVFDDLG